MDIFGLLLCLLLICALTQAIVSLRPRKYLLPPGPLPLPVIGNLLQLGRQPHKSLANLAKIHGPIITLKLGHITTIVVSSSTMARKVLQEHDLSFHSRVIPDTVTAFNHHEFSMAYLPVSPTWRTLRRICKTHIFAPQKLDANQFARRKKLQELILDVRESCVSGAAINIGEAAFKTILNLLSSTVFSVNLFGQSSGFSKDFKELVTGITMEAGKPNLGDYFPVLRKLDPQGARQRINVYLGKIIGLFDELIHQRLELRKDSSFKISGHDVLDSLIDVAEDTSNDIDINHVKHLLLDLFVAGTDTNASTTEWAMAELIRSPKILLKARKELNQVIGKGNLVEEPDIAKLPLLQAIIKETLRLHPPAPFLVPRKANTNVEISGFTVPKASQIWVNVWAIGRDPTLWENPNSFAPERFMVEGSDVDFKGRDFELIPFGAGSRICPGLPLAHLMLHQLVGSLVNTFDWKLEKGHAAEEMNMGDAFGLTLHMANPLRAVPIPY